MNRGWKSLGRALAAAAAAALLAGATGPAAPPDETTLFVVRHAEKDTTVKGDAQPLSARGRKRAQDLARILRESAVTRVFATPTRRAMDTAAPVVAAIGDSVRLVSRTGDLIAQLRALPWGERALVVGHSNTVPEIVAALSGRLAAPIHDSEYDRLYVVTLRRGGAPGLLLLRFGDGPPDTARTTRP